MSGFSQSRVLLLLVILILSHSVSLQASPSSLLLFSPGGRAGAFGGAFASVADDAEAALYNPAGMVLLTDAEAGVMYASRGGSFFSKDRIIAVDMAFPSEGYGVGGGLVYENLNSSEERTLLATLSSASIVARILAFGVGLDYLEDSRGGERASVLGGQVGFLVRPGQLSIGLSKQDWRGSLNYGDRSEDPPDILRLGVAYIEPGSRAPLVVEYRRARGVEEKGSIHAGVEVPAERKRVILRVGYSRSLDSGGNSFFLGLGMRLFEQADATSNHPLGYEFNAFDDLSRGGLRDARVELRRRRL
jgi:hypothetical protein